MLDPSYNTHLCFPSQVNDHSDSGVSSPTLWRTSPPKSPRHKPEDYWSLSPDSKAKAIARGQRELMEMVSKMPESCYELSMKDLVELKGNEEKVFDEMPQRRDKSSNAVRKVKSEKRMDVSRVSGVSNSGFLLKMMFPVSLGSKNDVMKRKKKKKDGDCVKDCQVSPRTSISEDKEWWNRLSESSGSTSTKRSGSSSSNRSNTSRSSQRDEKSSCFPFLWRLKQSYLQ